MYIKMQETTFIKSSGKPLHIVQHTNKTEMLLCFLCQTVNKHAGTITVSVHCKLQCLHRQFQVIARLVCLVYIIGCRCATEYSKSLAKSW